MGLEITDTIAGLVATNPTGADPVNQGDDHLQLIKGVLKNIFPGAGGVGFAVPINATEAQIDHLVGCTQNVQATFDDHETRITALEAANTADQQVLYAPTGTRMVFHQATAPAGWAQDVSNNDSALRVVNTAGGGTGGTDAFISGPTSTELHTLTSAESGLPAHNHVLSGGTNIAKWNTGAGGGTQGSGPLTGPGTVEVNNSSTFDAAQGHKHDITWAPLYNDVILCERN